MDLEIRCIVGLVSQVAVGHRRGRNLPAACEVIFQVNERKRQFRRDIRRGEEVLVGEDFEGHEWDKDAS